MFVFYSSSMFAPRPPVRVMVNVHGWCCEQAASVAVPLVSCYLTEAAAAATISR